MPVGVGEDLHLDVARVDHGLLQEHGRRRRTPTRPRASRPRSRRAARRAPATRRIPRPPPPATALTNTGKPMSVGRGDQRVDVGRRFRRVQHRAPRPPGPRRPRGTCCRSGAARSAGGPTNVMPASLARPRPAPGSPTGTRSRGRRVGAGPPRRLDHLVDRQVRAHRVARLADLVRLVGLGPVQRVAVLVREHRDRGHAELVGGAERPDRDLPRLATSTLRNTRVTSPRRGRAPGRAVIVRSERYLRHSIGPVRNTPPVRVPRKRDARPRSARRRSPRVPPPARRHPPAAGAARRRDPGTGIA